MGIWILRKLCPSKWSKNRTGHYIISYPGRAKEYHEIYTSTVGQYTGLTDKNGVKIFEGDICDFSVFDYNDCDTQYRGVVVYSGSRFMLWKSTESEYYGADGGFDLDWVIGQYDEFEVIGNIHDNPELLKEDGRSRPLTYEK